MVRRWPSNVGIGFTGFDPENHSQTRHWGSDCKIDVFAHVSFQFEREYYDKERV
jgi:hypothetical protein